MCIPGIVDGLGAARSVRDDVHSLTGMGNSETRGSGASPTVNVYTNQPGDDVKKTDDLKMPTGTSHKGGGSGY